MEEIEILKHAQSYIERLANGENPLDGSAINDDSVLNNVRIVRCLYYVNDILKKVIANGGVVSGKPSKPKKGDFVYDEEKAAKVNISVRPIALSVILNNVHEAFPECKKPSFEKVCELLKSKGILIDNPSGSPRYVASPEAAERGVWTEQGTNQAGVTYWRTLYDDAGQRLVIAALADYKS